MSRILVMDEALGPADGDQEVRDRISIPHPRAGSVLASRAGTMETAGPSPDRMSCRTTRWWCR
jgi:hypothetical protein